MILVEIGIGVNPLVSSLFRVGHCTYATCIEQFALMVKECPFQRLDTGITLHQRFGLVVWGQ